MHDQIKLVVWGVVHRARRARWRAVRRVRDERVGVPSVGFRSIGLAEPQETHWKTAAVVRHMKLTGAEIDDDLTLPLT